MNQIMSKKEELIDFEVFWLHYPLKQGKAAAVKVWDKIKPDSYLAGEIVEGVQKHQRSNRKWKEGYVPMAATFLNQERWKDELGVTRPPQPIVNEAGTSFKQIPSWGGYPSQKEYELAHTVKLGVLVTLVEQNPGRYKTFFNVWGHRMPKRLRDPLFKAAGMESL